MRTTIGTLCLSTLLTSASAQQPPPGETIGGLYREAQQQLSASVAELAQLREKVAAENLPLARELTAAEEKVGGLRKKHEHAARLVDSGNLEIAAIKSETTARRDELTYVGNLLDEYARNLETKIDVSELQRCGDAIASAKQAAENTSLPLAEKFTQQAAFAGVSVKRLADAVGGMRFDGVGVDETGAVKEGQFALIGPVALFRSNDGAAAGLVVPQTGSTKPLIRALDGELQQGIADVVQNGQGTLPLDPSLGGALKALVQKTNLIHVFEKGGPIMWPLLLASMLALATVLERLFFLLSERKKRDPQALERLFACVQSGDYDAAARVGSESSFYVVRMLAYALGHRGTSLASSLLYAQAQELKRFRRGVPILDTVITVAPLLGLLGTVTGMMGSFSLIGGELGAPGAITGGIAEALIATGFGLGIAILALLPFNFLNARLDEARHELESAATQLELIVNAAGHVPAAPIPPAARTGPHAVHPHHMLAAN